MFSEAESRGGYMSQSFSTDQVPVSDRLDAWRYNASQICGNCRFQFPKRYSFRGSIERRQLAGLELTRFCSSPLSFAKFPVVSAGSEKRSCIVITQLNGVRRYSQENTLAVLKPGDTTLIDSGLPWTSDCPSDCARLYLRVPWWLMQDRLRISSLPIVRPISGAFGLGATLFRLATSLYHEADMLTEDEGAAAIDAYMEILSACLGRAESRLPSVSHGTELSLRIGKYIETHLTEPGLGPRDIASAAGISVRHLHRLFSLGGRTVGDWIRRQRLEQCRSDLADPHFRERTITEIAFFWGFNDSAHFSRSFKRQFGVCPRTFRSHAWLKPWSVERAEEIQGALAGRREVRYYRPN
jgi:AraC family transcriptional activator of tynA and feaB